MKIKVVTHYHKYDTDFFEDYSDIEVFFDGEKVGKYGDWYHDKGQEKVVGGLDFLRAAGIEYEIEWVKVADREW